MSNIFKGIKMKQLIAILMAAFALTAFAAEPATTPAEKSKQGMKLAKKKDHSKDKKVDTTKSAAGKKTANKKTDNKSSK